MTGRPFPQRRKAARTGWARGVPASIGRRVVLSAFFRPLLKLQTRVSVEGKEVFDSLSPPVVLMANHCSHLDTPLILLSLPASWRRRTAVAAAADYFFASRLMGTATALAFGTFPIERNGPGRSEGIASELLRTKHNVLVYPEGTRSPDGKMGPFRHGAARLSIEDGVTVVPVATIGTQFAMPKGSRWIRRGRPEVRVRFGEPIRPEPGDIGRTLSLRARNAIATLMEPPT